MSQIWRGIGGGIEVLENVNEMADLPDISTVDSEGVWYIESGEFGPDYIAPTNWDSSAGEFTNWFSLFDGQILADVPDSVIHHYNPSNFTESIWPDEEGDSDMDTINGLSFNSSAFDSDDDGGVAGDGEDDYGQTDTMGDFGSNMTSNFAIVVGFEALTESQGRLLGIRNNIDDTRLQLQTQSTANSGNDTIKLLLMDSGGDLIAGEGPEVTDGEAYLAIINKTGNSANDIEIYLNDVENNVANSIRDEDFSNPSDFDIPMTYFAESDEGTIHNHTDPTFSHIFWFDDSLNLDERENVADVYGWYSD